MNKIKYRVVFCFAFLIFLIFFILLYKETQKNIREIDSIKNKIENQNTHIQKKDEESQKNMEKDIKVKKCEVLHPAIKTKNTLVYESFFDYLKKIMRLKIEITEDIDIDKIRVFLDENEMSMTLFFVGDDNVIYHLFKFEVIRYSDFYEKYSDSSKPEIIDDKDGYFLTRKLLKLEVGEDESDILASEIVAYFLKNKDSLTLEFIYIK